MDNLSTDFGKLLGRITNTQLQAALDKFELGILKTAKAIPFGLFGQNVFLETTSGKEYVLRTHAHYDWQLPTEQFFSQLIHEKTKVPAPWPYLFTDSEEVFGFVFGYAILPRLPGVALADNETYDRLNLQQKESLAEALAKTLHGLQELTGDESGKYDPKQQKIKPFSDGYIHRTISRIEENLKASKARADITAQDVKWLEHLLKQFDGLEENAFQPVVVHEDFNKNNMTVEFIDFECRVTGLFDLMTAHFGDGLADLPRQFSMFVESNPPLARRYLQAYFHNINIDGSVRLRLLLYLIDERLLVWEYFHRPKHIAKWKYEEKNFRKWLEVYFKELFEVVGVIEDN